NERVRFLRGRRQADQVEIESADKRAAFGFAHRGEPLLPQLGVDERIDRMARSGWRPTNQRGERPPIARIVFLDGTGRPNGPLIDPRPQQSDLVRGQRRFAVVRRRHDRARVEAGDETNEPAVYALADDDRWRAGVAAAQGHVATVESEAAPLL